LGHKQFSISFSAQGLALAISVSKANASGLFNCGLAFGNCRAEIDEVALLSATKNRLTKRSGYSEDLNVLVFRDQTFA
jgi:hypothetical protein